jgi:hypothetical protein
MVKNMSTEQVYPMRPKGKIINRVKPVVSGAEPEQQQNQNQNQRPKGVITKVERKPLPNRLCYPDAFKDWKPGMRVPKCRVCEGVLYPEENHVCDGFKPKYEEWTEERSERWEERRAAIREAKANGMHFEDDWCDEDDGPEDDWCDEDDYCEDV